MFCIINCISQIWPGHHFQRLPGSILLSISFFLLFFQQIVKILHLYTPDEYEKRTEIAFIRKVNNKLAGRGEMKKEAQLLIDAKHTFPVTFPYNPTSINLNEIDIPESFGLNFVKKIWAFLCFIYIPCKGLCVSVQRPFHIELSDSLM